MLYSLFKNILFKFDPEKVHDFIFNKLKYITGTSLEILIRQSLPKKTVNCMNIIFKNPIGLSAGFDKNGECIDVLSEIGFGFIETGTVTPKPQNGNNKPRLFRLIKANGLINRMGFNNNGVDNLVKNIKKSKRKCVIGVSIGKNKNTPIEKGIDDYLICMEKVYIYSDYIVINISSPNTSELRKMQTGKIFKDLLKSVKNKQYELYKFYSKYVPIAIKISPDLSNEELVKIAKNLIYYNIDCVIATNTTINHELIVGMNYNPQNGGLSGRPLQFRSTEVIKLLSLELKGKIPIIGSGGIDSIISAKEKIIAGATLLQIYSGFIFHGPKLIKEIIKYI